MTLHPQSEAEQHPSKINCDIDMNCVSLQKTKTLMVYKLCQTKSGPFTLGLYPAVSLHFSVLVATSLAVGFSSLIKREGKEKVGM